ncbi:MAG TPA: helix-turn-helix transcriptional regulator [Tepidiformaceae bacterium]|nr:helix-turn-helix transcriptional regulator [Tepidiformaceae bacterium]
MTARHASSAPPALTQRQREVLALIARGMTNYEIAQELGISLEGAKYHVREVMGRLGVSSREEAAEWYRAERRPSARIAAFVRGLAPFGAWKVAVGGAACVAVAAVGVLAVLALAGDEAPPPAADSGEPPLCERDSALFEVFEADPMDDTILLVVTGRAEHPCTLRGSIELTLTQGLPSASSQPVVAASSTPVDVVLDTVPVNVIHANWTGYCGGALVRATANVLQEDGLIATSAGTDLVNEPGCSQAAFLRAMFAPPLSFRPDLGPVEQIVCPIAAGWEAQCEVIDAVQDALTNARRESLFEGAFLLEFTCEGTSSTNWLPLCAGQPPGEAALGVPVQFEDGSTGALGLSDLQRQVEEVLLDPAYVATVGCINPDCTQFALGIAVRGSVPAMYISFDASGETAVPFMVGFPRAGALVLRRGGQMSMAGINFGTPAGASPLVQWLPTTTFPRVLPPY